MSRTGQLYSSRLVGSHAPAVDLLWKTRDKLATSRSRTALLSTAIISWSDSAALQPANLPPLSQANVSCDSEINS